MWIKYVLPTDTNKLHDIVCVENDEVAQDIINKGHAIRVGGPEGQDYTEEVETKEEVKSPEVTEVKKRKRKVKKTK